MPANAAYPFLDWPGPLPFAHQGGAADAPENTMAAFERLLFRSYRYLETDSHVTADGVLLAFHDDRLDRATDRTGVIADLPWSEVQQARVGGTEQIPTLEDLLAAFPDTRVNIDPKHDAAVEPLADLIRRLGVVDRVCIGSFSDRRLVRIRELVGDGLCVSMGPTQVARLVAAARGLPDGGGVTAPCAQVTTRQGSNDPVTPR